MNLRGVVNGKDIKKLPGRPAIINRRGADQDTRWRVSHGGSGERARSAPNNVFVLRLQIPLHRSIIQHTRSINRQMLSNHIWVIEQEDQNHRLDDPIGLR